MNLNSEAIKFQLGSQKSQRMSWSTLLCPARLHPKKSSLAQDRTDFEVDYDRLIFSKAFRRLARKTQVHPLAVNDHTHNRLTHSLEVASVGRSLGKSAHRIAQQHEPQGIPATAMDFAELVQAACLAHDVGNTPFGHAGERAIRHWMRMHTNILTGFTASQHSDLTLYEGNAQAFRIATRSVSGFENGCDIKQGGLGLTAATLATMMKYPWHSDHSYAQAEGKYSVFQSDVDAFDWVVNTTGLLQIDNAYSRHPLAFLVEAADDICNAIIDIEDAIDLHILSKQDVELGLMRLSGLQSNSTVAQMRASAIGNLIQQCLNVFNTNYQAIMLGQYQSPLITGIEASLLDAFNELNSAARNTVYPFEKNKNMEQGCFNLLAHILSASTDVSTELTQLEPDAIVAPYVAYIGTVRDACNSDYEKLMMIMDFVAGMTDNFAVNLAGRLNADGHQRQSIN